MIAIEAFFMAMVILGFMFYFVYRAGFEKGRKVGQAEEESKWKQTDEWKIKQAEKHI